MEDHMTSSDNTCTGSSLVTTATDTVRTDPDLQDLCDRVKVLEQTAGPSVLSDSYLRNRIRQLERSERSLLQLCQLAPSMQHSQRLDQRLHMLREEVRIMTQEKEREERVWRERLQRCQRQLKAKDEEMVRQSKYFENFKTQLQHKLSLAWDREQGLQNRIYSLEKQLLDMTVSAATGMAMTSAVRITAGTVTCWEQQLTSMRGEGEGEEEQKEERRKQWQPSVGAVKGEQGEDEGKTEKEGRNKDTKQTSNEARLKGFILSLQEDLKVLLEREEDCMTERRRLMGQLQEAQEKSHFLGCKVEEMKAEMEHLKLSESSLMEEVEGLREENHRLEQILSEAAKRTPCHSSQISESTCQSLRTSSPSCSTVCPEPSNILTCAATTAQSSVVSLGEVQPMLDEERKQAYSSAVAPFHHQAAADIPHINTNDLSSSIKSDPLRLFSQRGSKPNPSFQSLCFTAETIDEFKVESWCSRDNLNLEDSLSEESTALREAYRSLGLDKDIEALQEQSDGLEAALQHTQKQLQVMSEENSRLKLLLRKQAEEEEVEAERRSSREKLSPFCGLADHLQSSLTHNTMLDLDQNNLIQALNQENRALADRIHELLAHIDIREQEIKGEETDLRKNISALEEDRVRLEQENQEQGCLITELTRKTEDDLNTIMDLQQKLDEHQEQHNLEKCVDSWVKSEFNEKETQPISSRQVVDEVTTVSESGFQYNNHNDQFQNSQQNTLHVSSAPDHIDPLTKTIQTLKIEQEELLGCINSLREQQSEVALSVQTQTEEKQQLTRTVWGLKEQKDSISQSLLGLKQDREELSRTISGLKDSRDHFRRSMSGLKEAKEQLTENLPHLEREKKELIEFLSSGREEQDQIKQTLQSLQRESDQLSHVVLNLKLERDELTNSVKCLKQQRDQHQSSYTLQEDCTKLIKSANSLREEKERIEHSVSCLQQEEKQIRLTIQRLREESLQSALLSQSQTEERKECLFNPNDAGRTEKMDTLVETAEYAPQRCRIKNSMQEQSDLMKEIEALGEKLKKSQEELETTTVETKKLQSELCQSEVRRGEAEKKATQTAEKLTRLTVVNSQMEETNKENENLNRQIKELQSKMTVVVREKTEALSLKKQLEERYSILTAQLKAKTVALEELNSEYITLKRAQGNKDDLNAVLTSLRTRYNDIRAKYDALLKRKSQTDLDVAPLKAKLSCLVAKCQERNSLLVQMMKTMHRHGCADSTLTQHVEQLLGDTALQNYTVAFTPGSNTTSQDYSAGFTSGFISTFKESAPDQTSSAVLPSVIKHGFSECGVKSRDLKSHTCTTSESTTDLQDCSSEVRPAPAGALKRNANSPVETVQTDIQVSPSLVPLKGSLNTNTTKLLPSARGTIKTSSGPEKHGLHHPDMKRNSSVHLTSSGSSLSPPSPTTSTQVNLSRRLSSPEKIINLHEQLQKTLTSSFQAPVSRGRQQPRKSLSFSVPGYMSPSSQTKTQTLSFNNQHTHSLPVTTASSQATHTPEATTEPAATNRSTTLFNAVTSKSARVTLCPNMFTNHQTEADTSKNTVSAHSSSSNFKGASMTPNKSITSSVTKKPTTPTNKMSAISDVSDATHKALIALPPRATSVDSDILICSDVNPKTTASDVTASSILAAPKVNIFNVTSKKDGAACDGFVFTQPTHCSPESSNKSGRKSTAALEKTKVAKLKQEAPAQVCSVEVIKTVGQSSLMIGWERPTLDELGCSNGTFVYGYRVFLNGDFHKSIMSSACTKSILENVDLSVPVHISIQTLGSNGLTSDSVHTMYRTTFRTDQH